VLKIGVPISGGRSALGSILPTLVATVLSAGP
jgi:hypothetical protein